MTRFMAVIGAVLLYALPASAQSDLTVNIGFQHSLTDYAPQGLRVEGLYAPGTRNTKGLVLMGAGVVTGDDVCHRDEYGNPYCNDANAIHLYYGFRITRPITADGVLSWELQGLILAGLAWWDYTLSEDEIGVIGGAMGRAMFLFDLGIPITLGVGLDIGLGLGMYKEEGLEFYFPLGGELVLRYSLE